MSPDKSTTIHPAEFQSPQQRQSDAISDQPAASSRPLKPVLIMAGLLALAGLTLFYLPSRIAPPPDVAALPSQDMEAVPQEQPFADTELLQARREAQDILAQLVVVQNDLQYLEVETWAQDGYQSLISRAQQGDSQYQTREFEAALASYQAALAEAQNLLAQRQQFADRLIEQGQLALTNGNAPVATERFRLALKLNPASEVARIGRERSAVLDEVSQLKLRAEESAASEDWEQAKVFLEQAVLLDPRDEQAQQALAQAQQQITERQFRERLAEGFNALAETRYADARSAFQQADQLRPGSPTVRDALLQVNSAAETRQRNTLLDRGMAAESAEDWQAAVSLYKDLLMRNSANVEARVGLVRAEARAGLDARIEAVLADPLALQSDEAWNSAEKLLLDARNLQARTPRLATQIAQLELLIRRARTPIQLTLLSDGQTQIEIYRLGVLGALEEHRVNIYPGEYVLVGRRSGYRDVRQSIEITGEQAAMSLRIEVTEPIN